MIRSCVQKIKKVVKLQLKILMIEIMKKFLYCTRFNLKILFYKTGSITKNFTILYGVGMFIKKNSLAQYGF